MTGPKWKQTVLFVLGLLPTLIIVGRAEIWWYVFLNISIKHIQTLLLNKTKYHVSDISRS